MKPFLPIVFGGMLLAFGIGYATAATKAEVGGAARTLPIQHGSADLKLGLQALMPQPDAGANEKPLPEWVFKDLGKKEEDVKAAAASAAKAQSLQIGQTFRRDLTAVVRTSTGYVIWVVDRDRAGGRRSLKIGDIYRDGWKIAGIKTDVVELKRAGEKVDVLLSLYFENAQPQMTRPSASAPSSTPSSALPVDAWPKGDPRSTATRRSHRGKL